jgi:hypothetical protein
MTTEPSEASKGLPAAILAATVAGAWGCHVEGAANGRPDTRLSFLNATDKGYRVVELDGREGRLLPVNDDGWVKDFTPDLSGYFIVRFPSPDHILLTMVSGSHRTPIYEGAWSYEARRDSPKVTWARPDGSAALVMAAGSVWLWSLCAEPHLRVLLKEDVNAFAASSERFYYATASAPAILRWQSWTARDTGAVSLPFTADFLWVGEHPYDLVVGRGSDEGLSQLALVDSRGIGSARVMPIPVSGVVANVVSLEGTPELAFSWSDGRDGFDGQTFSLVHWNYATGAWRVLVEHPGGYLFHVSHRDVFGADLSSYEPCLTRAH